VQKSVFGRPRPLYETAYKLNDTSGVCGPEIAAGTCRLSLSRPSAAAAPKPQSSLSRSRFSRSRSRPQLPFSAELVAGVEMSTSEQPDQKRRKASGRRVSEPVTTVDEPMPEASAMDADQLKAAVEEMALAKKFKQVINKRQLEGEKEKASLGVKTVDTQGQLDILKLQVSEGLISLKVMDKEIVELRAAYKSNHSEQEKAISDMIDELENFKFTVDSDDSDITDSEEEDATSEQSEQSDDETTESLS
jgi:hypothetical protein